METLELGQLLPRDDDAPGRRAGLGPFRLPVDVATSTFGILATKGAGKSNAAVVMAEELYDAGVPWVAIDPKGDWWGMRSSADGKGPGLPIVVFGGRHGDLPLEATAGTMLAELVLEHRLTCVLDVSEFTKGETIRFLQDFGTRLFRLAHDEVMHLFLEEAHEYLPQTVKNDYAEMVGTWQRIVKQGRFKGLGVTLISQRSASLNKDVLELVDTLMVLRTVGPRSRDAVKAWISDQDVQVERLRSLPTLDDGEAWVWSPGALKIMERIRFRRRRTFDSGATPKVGQPRKPPSTLADIDLGAVKDAMADTIEKVKAADPKELTKRIRQLEADLRSATARADSAVAAQPEVVELEVPVLTVEEERLVGRLIEALGSGVEIVSAALASVVKPVPPKPDVVLGGKQPPLPPPPAKLTSKPPTPPRATTPPMRVDGLNLGKGEKKVLAVLAEYPEGRTHNELAFLAGYSAKASTIGVTLSKLRKLELVEPAERDQPIRPTAAGLEAAGGRQERPTGPALLEQWLRHPRMGEGERRVLAKLVELYPHEPTHEELCTETDYSPTASTMGVILSKLRKLGLVEKGHRRLAPEFHESIQ